MSLFQVLSEGVKNIYKNGLKSVGSKDIKLSVEKRIALLHGCFEGFSACGKLASPLIKHKIKMRASNWFDSNQRIDTGTHLAVAEPGFFQSGRILTMGRGGGFCRGAVFCI